MKQLRRITLLIILSGLQLVMDTGCNECNPLFYQQAWGTWLLVRLDSPAGTQTVFPVRQTLKIALSADRSGDSFDEETLYTDDKEIGRNRWETFDPDCRNNTFTAIYDQALRRKYWITNSRQGLRATGYVDQIGGKADTLTYYYQRVQ